MEASHITESLGQQIHVTSEITLTCHFSSLHCVSYHMPEGSSEAPLKILGAIKRGGDEGQVRSRSWEHTARVDVEMEIQGGVEAGLVV